MYNYRCQMFPVCRMSLAAGTFRCLAFSCSSWERRNSWRGGRGWKKHKGGDLGQGRIGTNDGCKTSGLFIDIKESYRQYCVMLCLEFAVIFGWTSRHCNWASWTRQHVRQEIREAKEEQKRKKSAAIASKIKEIQAGLLESTKNSCRFLGLGGSHVSRPH